VQKPLDRYKCCGEDAMRLRVFVFVTLISVVVAAVMAFFSITVAFGDVGETIRYQDFWIVILKSMLWLFLSGFTASVISLIFISKSL
jgi:hypothetical protein